MIKPFKIPFTNIYITAQEKQVSGRGYAAVKSGGIFGMQDMMGYKLSYESLYVVYRNQGDIYSCIKEWRENVGAGGYKWQVPNDPEREVPDDKLKELDGVFNYSLPFRQLKSRTVRDLGVTGNAYWAIVWAIDQKTVVGFQILDPRTMSIVCDKYGTVIKYVQRAGQATITFEPQEIIHFRIDTDPNNEIFGFSPMEPIIWEARTDLQAMMTNYNFFKNMGLPAAYYILEEGMNKDAVDEAIDVIKTQFKGSENYNRSGVLKGVKEIKTLNVSNKDMEFLQGRQFTTGKICAAYGVPKFMIGYTDSVNNNNGTELQKKFYSGTIAPLEEMIAEVINRDFIGRTGYKDLVKFVFNPQAFDEQAQIEERAQKEVTLGLLTVRQYKKKTGQEISSEDEKTENLDSLIIHNGASATLLGDVGIDPLIDQENSQVAQNLIEALNKK